MSSVANTQKLRMEQVNRRTGLNAPAWFPCAFLLQHLAESDTHFSYWDNLAFSLACEFLDCISFKSVSFVASDSG